MCYELGAKSFKDVSIYQAARGLTKDDIELDYVGSMFFVFLVDKMIMSKNQSLVITARQVELHYITDFIDKHECFM